MKAQISRDSHRPDRHFGGVYHQQGRMLTDADWNELVDVLRARARRAAACAMGTGVPADGGALVIDDNRVAPGRPSPIVAPAWGRVVVDGIVADVLPDPGHAGAFDYAAQLAFPDAPPLPAGDHTLYVDVWERLVIAAEDDGLLDPALHGADTCVRTQVLAQVKHCASAADVTDAALNPPQGDAVFALQNAPSVAGVADPCGVDTALALDLGNALFRLEVQAVHGPANAPTKVVLTWSSENGAEAHAVDARPAEFTDKPYVYEFFSRTTELHVGTHLNGGPVQRSALATDGYPATAPTVGLPGDLQLVRRWDGFCELLFDGKSWSFAGGPAAGLHLGAELTPAAGSSVVTASGDFAIRIGDLVLSLACGGKTFVAGDHWLALLRRHTGAEAGAPAPEPSFLPLPVGIVHHFLPLVSFVGGAPAAPSVADGSLRARAFPRLTDLTAPRVGYDPSVTTVARWQAISDDPAIVPRTVQDAIDLLAAELDASEIAYSFPTCGGTASVQSLLSTLPGWPDVDGDGFVSVKDAFDALLCHLDASRIPYSTSEAETIRDWLDTLRADVDARVKIAGDHMDGDLRMKPTAKIGIHTDTPGGALHVAGGGTDGKFGKTAAGIEVDVRGDKHTALQANGAKASYRLDVSNGHGDVNRTWNAFGDGTQHTYDTKEIGAAWWRIEGGDVRLCTAPPSTSDPIDWSCGFRQDEDGHVHVGSPADPADERDLTVSGLLWTKRFRMPDGAASGLVLTSDAQGHASWAAASGSGWVLSGKDVYQQLPEGRVAIGEPAGSKIGGKLSVKGTAGSLYVGPTQSAIEVVEATKRGDAAFVAVGSKRGSTDERGAFRLTIHDGSARVTQTWNARAGKDASGNNVHFRDRQDPAVLLRMGTNPDTTNGRFGVLTAPSDDEGTVIAWKTCLEVDEDGDVWVPSGALRPSAGGSESAGIRWPSNPGAGSGDTAWIRYFVRDGQDTTLQIGIANNMADHIELKASGNVGVDTSTPSEKLHVNGRFLRVDGTNGEAVYLGGDGTTILRPGTTAKKVVLLGSMDGGCDEVRLFNKVFDDFMHLRCHDIWHKGLHTHSDAALKENVAPLEGALESVLGLRGVSFDWIDGAGPQDENVLGFVAQEVADVRPDLVVEDGDGRLALRSTGFAPLLVEAVKEQQARIDALERELAALRERLE